MDRLSRPNLPVFRSPDEIDRVQVCIARSRTDWVSALQLLQRRYCEAGLSPAKAVIRVLPYHLWPETQLIVAKHRDQVIGSVSLTRDGNTEGIPMEATYRDAVAELRRQGTPFGEVCSLSVDSPEDLSTGEIFGQLTRLMMFHARFVGLDKLIAVVHPRHAKFYQRAMGFQTIGGLCSYPHVGGQPGIPILGHVNDRSHYRSRWQRFYFAGEYAPAELSPHTLSQADLAFFRQFLSTTNWFKRGAA